MLMMCDVVCRDSVSCQLSGSLRVTGYRRSRSFICERLELLLEMSSVTDRNGQSPMVGMVLSLRRATGGTRRPSQPSGRTPRHGELYRSVGVRCDIDGKAATAELVTLKVVLRIDTDHILPPPPQAQKKNP